MTSCEGVVSGSMALSLILRPCAWEPNNLNLVVPRNRWRDLHGYFRDNGYTSSLDMDACAIKAQLIDFVVKHRTYITPGQCQTHVTVTESADDSVLPVILADSCTADMIFVTIGGIVCTHPCLLLTQISLRGYRCSPVSDNFAGRFYTKQFIVLDDTAEFPGECGESCPLVWRSIESGASTMIINWSLLRHNNESDSLCPRIVRHPYWWRLSDQCFNRHCSIRQHNISVTRKAVISEEQIVLVCQQIANHPISLSNDLVNLLTAVSSRC